MGCLGRGLEGRGQVSEEGAEGELDRALPCPPLFLSPFSSLRKLLLLTPAYQLPLASCEFRGLCCSCACACACACVALCCC